MHNGTGVKRGPFIRLGCHAGHAHVSTRPVDEPCGDITLAYLPCRPLDAISSSQVATRLSDNMTCFCNQLVCRWSRFSSWVDRHACAGLNLYMPETILLLFHACSSLHPSYQIPHGALRLSSILPSVSNKRIQSTLYRSALKVL